MIHHYILQSQENESTYGFKVFKYNVVCALRLTSGAKLSLVALDINTNIFFCFGDDGKVENNSHNYISTIIHNRVHLKRAAFNFGQV